MSTLCLVNHKRLISARQEQGITQAALAHLSGVHIGTISRIERDQSRMPNLATINALAAALKINPASLLVLPAGPFANEGL